MKQGKFKRGLSLILAAVMLLYGVVPPRVRALTLTQIAAEPEQDLPPVYEDGVILLYSYDQLCLVGTGEWVCTGDGVDIGTGELVYGPEGQLVTYAPDGDYAIARDIPLPEGQHWQLPADFTGTIEPLEASAERPVCDGDGVCLYNPYQLQMLQAEDAARQPVLTGDGDIETFGVGQLTYPEGEEEFVTYGQDRTYVLSTQFSAAIPETEATAETNATETTAATEATEPAAEPMAETKSQVLGDKNDIYGRDFVGQVLKTIGDKQYILIGNEPQLRAIGTDTEVWTTVYQVDNHLGSDEIDQWQDENGVKHPIILYSGDADLTLEQNGVADYTFHQEPEVNKSISCLNKTGTKDMVGVIQTDGSIDPNDSNNWKTGVKYDADANYIIFRDIDLNADNDTSNWKPLAFSGNMVGAKLSGQETKLWDSSGITATGKPRISNITVVQLENRNANETKGVGFFSTLCSQLDPSTMSAKTKASVRNLILENVSIRCTATKAENNDTVLDTVLGGLGTILGGVADLLVFLLTFGQVDLGLRDLLELLLSVREDDPAFYATGGFAGQITGDVSVEDCTVRNVTVCNVTGYAGGFVGYTEGYTQYLLGALSGLTDFLANVLNAIPYLGLGDVVSLLLELLPLEQLIIVGYVKPTITRCTVEGLSGIVGNQETVLDENGNEVPHDRVGGFIGDLNGMTLEQCSVSGNYEVVAQRFAGGFVGLARDAQIEGTLSELVGTDYEIFYPQSLLFNCDISGTVTVNGTDHVGGFAGLLANSYAIDSDMVGSSLTVEASGSNAGGFAGTMTLGYAVNVGSDEYGDTSLIGTVDGLLTGLLGGQSATNQQALLSLAGVGNSTVLGCKMTYDSITVSAAVENAGGFVGTGEGMVLGYSDRDSLKEIPLWSKDGVEPPTCEERGNTIIGLTSVTAGEGYAGGVAGLVGTAHVGGLLDETLGLGRMLGFTVKDVTVRRTAPEDEGTTAQPAAVTDEGYTVTAGKTNDQGVFVGGNYAGGGFGFAMGGTITNVQLYETQSVSAGNYAGGFVGRAGPGDVAGDGGIDLKLLGLNLLKVENLLSVGQGIEVKISDSSVTGIENTGFTVSVLGDRATGSVTDYIAGGFIAKSNSTELTDCHVYNLNSVVADKLCGYAGGFVGTSETGGLADVGTAGSVEGLLGDGGLLGINGLLKAVAYMIPDYSNCTVHYTNLATVQADVAGGFAGDFQSGYVNTSWESEILTGDQFVGYEPPGTNGYAVYDLKTVTGQTYAGGFAGKLRSGALAEAGGGISLLGGLDVKISVSDLLSVAEAYVPFVSYAGVSSPNGFTVQAAEVRDGDYDAGSAGGFVGYASGAQISHCNVNCLANTGVGVDGTNGFDSEYQSILSTSGYASDEMTDYFEDMNCTYAVRGGRYAGGFVGHMDVGNAASIGNGLSLFGNKVLDVGELVQGLSVVVSTIENSSVTGARGGYAVRASAEGPEGDKPWFPESEETEPEATASETTGSGDDETTEGVSDETVLMGMLGSAGGFAGQVSGGHIQDSHAHNFSHIIGEVSAGGYVGTMTPGSAASVLTKDSLLHKVLNADNLLTLLQDFVPTIRNSSTDCIPCGGTVRAIAASSTKVQRGMAGGYVGYNEGGQIWGMDTDAANPSVCKAKRIAYVFGEEYAGGYTGYMESASTVDAGSVSVLGGLIEANNLLGALKAAYPTQHNTEVTGPLTYLDDYTDAQWLWWVQVIGLSGNQGLRFAQVLAKADANNSEVLEDNDVMTALNTLRREMESKSVGFRVETGRETYNNMLPTTGGDAGGYVGRMTSGEVYNAVVKKVQSVRGGANAGGFAGTMRTGELTTLGSVELLGGLLKVSLNDLLSVGQVFVPAVRNSVVYGDTSGLTVTVTGLKEKVPGDAGGFVGSTYGGQLWGDAEVKYLQDIYKSLDNDTLTARLGCNVYGLLSVRGDGAAGGFVGRATAGSLADVNTGDASSDMLQTILDTVLSTPGDLVSVLDASMTTITRATVSAADADWGFTVGGYSESAATYAGGFAGLLEAAVVGEKDGHDDALRLTANVNGLRRVEGKLYAGGFFGLGDATGVATVGDGGGVTVLEGLLGLGETSVLDAFRTYVYDGNVSGVPEGFQVIATDPDTSEGTLGSTRYRGCAGGFGGGLMNGSIHRCTVTNLNAVTAPNYAGGFVGHLGKGGIADVDSAGVGNLLDATAGVLDVFGSYVEDCTLSGIASGFLVHAENGAESIAGGFAGFGDLSRLKNIKVTNAKQITSDDIAGGFVGKTTFAYLVDVQGGNSPLLDALLIVVNALVKALYLPQAERVDLVRITIPGLSGLLDVKLLSDGDLVYVNLLGIKISASLSQAEEGSGQDDVVKLTIGDSIVELKCNENGIISGEEENLRIGLIKANRSVTENCTITGISDGYDVYGGGATNEEDGNGKLGYAGGFVGYNDEGRFADCAMFYCDVVRGAAGLVAPFSGSTSLNTVYHFNTLASIEGENNTYRIYRSGPMLPTELHLKAVPEEELKPVTVYSTYAERVGNTTYSVFTVNHLNPVGGYDHWQDATMTVGSESTLAGVYETPAKAVLMDDIPTGENPASLVPQPQPAIDPCTDQPGTLTVNKIWRDYDDIDHLRPESVEVQVYRSTWDFAGKLVTENADYGHPVTLTANPQSVDSAVWAVELDSVPFTAIENDQRVYYTYTVREVSVPAGYSSVSNDETMTVTNTHLPNLPDTGAWGDGVYVGVGVGLLLLSEVLRKRRRPEPEGEVKRHPC